MAIIARLGTLWLELPNESGSINQGDIPERGLQVAQMRRIYENSETVVIWLGPDNERNEARVSIDAIVTICDFICQSLGIPTSKLGSTEDIYQDIIFRNRDELPHPDQTPFSSDKLWQALIWFYSHSYFTRVWVIQELSANKNRFLHCGVHATEWDKVELVAGYITMETAFSQAHGFSDTYCWWLSTVGGELVKRPHKWLFLLYLASNFIATDARDVIYGLRGLMTFKKGSELLNPDYNKSAEDVYRASVEAALVNFEKTDVLLYLSGKEKPSWVPRWDIPMLFRNPFRFGKTLPWKPAGSTNTVWKINREDFVISLTGFRVGTIRVAEPYNEQYFGNAVLTSEGGREEVKHHWERILEAFSSVHAQLPFSRETLTKTAVSLSYGLNEQSEVEHEQALVRNFAAYLKIVLDDESYTRYVPPDVADSSQDADGRAFGKPVWDFTYPESSFFILDDGLVGSCVSPANPGDIFVVPLGSTYPLVLRSEDDHFTIRGFAFVHGIMQGELKDRLTEVFEIY
jgi:hypothetical protein